MYKSTVQTVHKCVKLVFDTRLPPSFNDVDRYLKRIIIGSKNIVEKTKYDEVLKQNKMNIRNLGYIDMMPDFRQNKELHKLDPIFFQFSQYDHYCLEQITHPNEVRQVSIHIYILRFYQILKRKYLGILLKIKLF